MGSFSRRIHRRKLEYRTTARNGVAFPATIQFELNADDLRLLKNAVTPVRTASRFLKKGTKDYTEED